MDRDEWQNLGLNGVDEQGRNSVTKDNPKDGPKV